MRTLPPPADPKPRLRALKAHLDQLDTLRQRADEALTLGVYRSDEHKRMGHQLVGELETKVTRIAVALLHEIQPDNMEGITVDEHGFIDRADMAEHYDRLEAVVESYMISKAGRLS
jgi:hypothetical protein